MPNRKNGKDDKINKSAAYSPVRDDNIPFENEEESKLYTSSIGDNYVVGRQLDVTVDELEKLSITDLAEIYRLYVWYRKDVNPDDTAEKRAITRQKLESLAGIIARKLLRTDRLYCLYNKSTGEPHLFSKTLTKEGGYVCTSPNIRVFTEAYAKRAEEAYPEIVFEMKRIDRLKDEKRIESFLGECFYQNGAQAVEVNSEFAVVSASMLIAPPDFSGVADVSVPVLNPDLMRWVLLMAQMPEPVTANEKTLYRIYYRFLAKEMVKARFLVPMKPGAGFTHNRTDTSSIKLSSGAEFTIATMKGKFARDAVIMYSDWRRLRECYNGWSASVMTAAEVIPTFDLAVNPTNQPKLGFYVNKEMFEDMQKLAES